MAPFSSRDKIPSLSTSSVNSTTGGLGLSDTSFTLSYALSLVFSALSVIVASTLEVCPFLTGTSSEYLLPLSIMA